MNRCQSRLKRRVECTISIQAGHSRPWNAVDGIEAARNDDPIEPIAEETRHLTIGSGEPGWRKSRIVSDFAAKPGPRRSLAPRHPRRGSRSCLRRTERPARRQTGPQRSAHIPPRRAKGVVQLSGTGTSRRDSHRFGGPEGSCDHAQGQSEERIRDSAKLAEQR